MAPTVRRALLLSGGTTLGAYQVGPLEKLQADRDTIRWVAGVSVGALNGAMYAQDKLPQLVNLWMEVNGRDWFMRPTPLTLLAPGLRGAGVTNLDPLERRIRQRVDPADLKVPFYAGVCNFHTDCYENVALNDLDRETAVKVLVASAAQPVIMRGQLLDRPDGRGGTGRHLCFDGGVRNVIPKMQSSWDPTHIDLVMSKPLDRIGSWSPGPQVSVFEIAGRALKTYDDGVVLAGLLRLWLAQKRGIHLRLWAPTEEGDGFDAARATIRRRLEHSRTIRPIEDPAVLDGLVRRYLEQEDLEPLADVLEQAQIS